MNKKIIASVKTY